MWRNHEEFLAEMKVLQAQNIAKGLCPDCGGAGVVADLPKMNRTGDPHVNRRCRTCRGTGKPKQAIEV